MGSVEPMSRAGVALDLILKTLIASQDFNNIQSKNWEAISKLVPGTTAGMVARRYEELLYSGDILPFEQFEKTINGQGGSLPSTMSDSDLAKNRPNSSKPKGLKDDKDAGGKDSNSDSKKYLSTDAQRWEEVDISVHCDVQIFEWLMHYVKRSDHGDKPKLAIVGTPCNMNCINDKLVASKLFAKKLERLFEADFTNQDCPENASTLFRMTIDKRGQLTFCHVRDTTFDVNAYLIDLKTQLKSWREVYWRVWGTIHYQTCSRCGEVFTCTDYGHCKYHPEAPRYDNEMSDTSFVGTYPCCHQKSLRFDPTQQNKGCRVRDHIVNTAQNLDSDTDLQRQLNKVYDDLLAHRDAISVPYQRLTDASEMELNVFGNEEFASRSRSGGVAISSIISGIEDDNKATDSARPVPRLQALTVDREVSFEFNDVGLGESDDEVGDDEQPRGTARKGRGFRKSRITIEPQAILMDAPGFEQTKKSNWDISRSMRYNQDAQRTEDLRRMKEIRVYLTKLRLNQEKIERPRQREYAGGVFCKLEAQWKTQYMQQQAAKQQAQAQLRNRSRLTQLRTSLA
ncbi:K1841-like protein [Mya arenaria]|uniref:K1841-like protein n=1 Tax=Mya arenaria TaxID=6604 RepID=A0ABY7E0K0_MYAAR|nr:K1841-like protein [Mya arenaria]